MYQEALKNKSPFICVETEEAFRDLMKEVDEETVIVCENPIRVHPVSDDETYIVENETAAESDLVLDMGSGSQPLTPSAIHSVIARADLTCRLIADLIDRGKTEDAVKLLNDGLRLKGENRSDDQHDGKVINPCQIVTRGGWVIAALSNQWAHLPQSELAECVLDEIRAIFPEAEFVKCTYTHDLTEFWISLGNHKSDIMRKYRNAWISSGYPEEELEKVKPLVRVCTSDTGQSGVVVTPILQDRSYNRMIGDRLYTKHAGKNSLKDVKSDLTKTFARAQETLEAISRLMSTPLSHPVAVMVRAMEHGKRSLYSLSQSACEEVLQNFKLLYGGISGVSAYDVYASLAEMEYCDKVKNLKNNSAIQIVEAIYRLIDLDWTAMDVPGKAYLGDGLKKKGGRP